MSLSNLDNPMDYPAVRSWLNSVNTLTGRRYYYYLKGFCSFSKLSPRQLVSLAQRDKIAIKERLAEFYQELVRRAYASNTRHNQVIAVRSFLSYNEIRFGKTSDLHQRRYGV